MSTKKKRLVVIDGKSVFYRGFYAMPYLSTKEGKPTGGVYGFAVMALEVLKKMEPDYICVAWDKPKTNIRRRREIYPAYKANRKPAPPEFYEQVPILMELLEAFNIPLYEIDDHEADDIMATFAKQAHEKGYESIMVTSDHDVLQLIDDSTVVATLKKGLTNVDYYDPKRFEAKYSMTPTQFIDYKALRGDPSDNLPGVAGVGEKTAIQLIADYQTLDGVYDHLDEIKGSLQTKLRDNKELAYTTQQLVILDKDIPLELEWDRADVSKSDGTEIAQILRDLEFKSLLTQLPEGMKQSASEVAAANTFVVDAKPVAISNKKDLDKLKKSTAKEVVIYTYTNTDLKALLISTNKKEVFVINLDQVDIKDVKPAVARLLQTHELVGFDTKAVMKSLIQSGIGEATVKHDAHMASFLINSLNHSTSMTDMASAQLGYEGESLDDLSPEDVIIQAPLLVSIIWALYAEQTKELSRLTDIDKLAKNMEWPLINVLARMEIAGVQLDTKFMAEMSDRLADQIVDVEQEIYGHADQEFNISSPSQLADILFDKLGMSTTGVKKGKNGYSTAANELDKLRGQHPIIDLITKYRELSKLKNTYVDPLPELVDKNSKLHTTFATWVAPTGRLSSHDPNLQNIPIRSELGKEIRKAFVAGKGNALISADYSQFELRLAAVLAGDDELIESFNDGLDIHTRTAAQVYGCAMEDVTKDQRRDAKVINFGILYGMSPHGLSVATGMTQADAKKFIDKYFELRKPLLAYISHTRHEALDKGHVQTTFGRRRPTPDVKSSNFVAREAAYRAAINHPIQGTEADLMKLAMIELDKKLDDDCIQLLQIHDSILVEAPEVKAEKVGALMKAVMEKVYKLPVNLDVDVSIGKNWGEL